jgi:hypothetical protein
MNFFSSILFITLLSTTGLFAQEIPILHPQLGVLIDLSPEGEKNFYAQLENCAALFEKINLLGDPSKLTEKELQQLDICEGPESYYDILGPGCSWYCGGGLDTLSASSFLSPGKNTTYSARNIHDLSYETAWVEGAKDDGIGEFIEYHFPPENPRINKLTVVNGYVKSQKTWIENSRVKKLKMYINDQVVAIIFLEDVKNEQIFQVDPIGYSERKDYDVLLTKPWYTIKFEIMEVYPGSKYKDTAITEIYFDGIDVH